MIQSENDEALSACCKGFLVSGGVLCIAGSQSGHNRDDALDMFSNMDDLDDDVGIVDAEVLEMLLSRG